MESTLDGDCVDDLVVRRVGILGVDVDGVDDHDRWKVWYYRCDADLLLLRGAGRESS